ERDGRVVGWIALVPASPRECYAGVAEVSVYIAEETRGQGVGSQLLAALIESSERGAIWTLQAGVFPEHDPSLGPLQRVGGPAATAARRRNDCRDGLVWATRVEHVTRNRTGLPRERAEGAAA